MVDLYGQKLSRTGLAERTGALQQVAGVELLELADGPERGVRVLALSHRRRPLVPGRGRSRLRSAWAPTGAACRSAGARRPGRATRASPRPRRTPAGASCARSPACSRPAAWTRRWRRPRPAPSATSIRASIATTIRCTAASRRSRRAFWPMASAGRASAARCSAEAEVAQMAVFGENLVLTRRIEAELGGTRDRDRGPGREPRLSADPAHAALPLQLRLAAARSRAASSWRRSARSCTPSTTLRGQGTGYRTQGPPQADFREQVYQHDVVAGADGMASALLINPQPRRRRARRAPRLRPDGAALPDRMAVPAVRPLRPRHRALDQPFARAQLRRSSAAS